MRNSKGVIEMRKKYIEPVLLVEDFTMLASGNFRHSESDKKRQSQSI